MATDEEKAFFLCSGAAAVIAFLLKKENQKRRRRRLLSAGTISEKVDNNTAGILKNQEISDQYKIFPRMRPSNYEDLLQKIAPRIRKVPTAMREPIPVQDRFAVTMRFLVSGENYGSLGVAFKMSRQVVSSIVLDVCGALVDVLKEGLKQPSNPTEWKEISKVFNEELNLPHCIGVLDGRHVILSAPLTSGTNFWPRSSIELCTIVDSDYKFLYADARYRGQTSIDSFIDCNLHTEIGSDSLGVPEPHELPGRLRKIPYYFVADSALPLMGNVITPYSGIHEKGSTKAIFNYRLSRGRRVAENVFGLMGSVFRVLRKDILVHPNKAIVVVMAILHLHNYLRTFARDVYMPPDSLDSEENGIIREGSWRSDSDPVSSLFLMRGTPTEPIGSLENNRDELADYFVQEGAVSWQNDYA